MPPRDGARTFTDIPVDEFLKVSPEERAALVKARVLIIGAKLFSLDLHRTPLTARTWIAMSGVDIRAQMTAELIDGRLSYSELGPIKVANVVRASNALLACFGFTLGARI